ncbi:MAG: SAM-dependent DNA methyltransferase [Actinomycetales bacterium]|nr:SAM-dependent DNA methyltransferase [Candidatus Phosphoribacter baldrii]
MSVLSSGLRKQLESAVLSARRAAEGASRAAVEGLGVFVDRRPEHLDAGQAALRNGLRAKWRQLGGGRELLVGECAYEQWHRLLFARFLAENGLLLHPQYKAPVTLVDCEELAAELGEPDGWAVAARFAAEILPGIFRLDDPCVRIRLAPEGRHALEEILAGLPTEMFIADDALGWVYQFWQKDKKDEVNASERKIGSADLGPVTQLFTENYMVRFLLENSLGAWWAARHPDSALIKSFDYLRFGDDGAPAAGSFEGWPEWVAEVTVMDPCCGSGHFLVEAFSMLWQMRAEEEGLSAVKAQDAVLRDNLFGLELDLRCVQIAMFAVALQAWKAGGGWRQLPVPHIACSGIPVRAPVDEWKALAKGNKRLENALARLHILFRDADTLGSLIDPKRATENTDRTGLQASFDDVDWDDIAPLLQVAVHLEAGDPATAVLGADAAGIARAADYLSRHYTLVATNVPYLGSGGQSDVLKQHLELHWESASADLATAFFMCWSNRLLPSGSVSLVLPQAWLFQASYRSMRRHLLQNTTWNLLARLGPRAFTAITGEVVNVCLFVSSKSRPSESHVLRGVDVSTFSGAREKSEGIVAMRLSDSRQINQLGHPGCKVSLDPIDAESLLSRFADVAQGLKTGDNPRFVRTFWEHPEIPPTWRRLQGAVAATTNWGGRSEIVSWERGRGELVRSPQARIQGQQVWTRPGVLVREIGDLPATMYSGDAFQSNAIAVVPKSPELQPAIWAYLSSREYHESVRLIDAKLGIATASAVAVPFDRDLWESIASERFPDGLPEPCSDDPTQWLFDGRPEVATEPLQVAVARLVGFRWPEQAESDDLDGFADSDGIVCLPSVAGEAPAADRVRQLLATAYGDRWAPSTVAKLLSHAGSKKKSLADWLRDECFKQHCSVFQNRPFVWHVWDGLRDGFSALVNYHRLDRKMLEKLTYTYLGTDWVERQRAEVRDEVAGADARLTAALELQRKLELILEGEAPFDVYVRWKSLAEQPIGWDPDLNDGVRLNIRPFVEAGVLRSSFNILWRKDRGTNLDGSERHNDVHCTLADKTNARAGQART